jgi:hypothetical protein
VIAFAAGQAITSLALAALLGKLGDDDDDEKDKALKIAYWTMLDPLMATIPFGVAQSDIQWAVERMVTGEKDYKYSPQMIPLLNTFTQFAVDAKELNTNRLVDDAVGLLGYGFGLPRTQALRIMKATENAEDPIEWAARAFGAQDWYD